MAADLGERMRVLMKRYGMTQSQLAIRANTSQPNISKYLSGERQPSSETLANIATALHTTSEYLLGLPESSTKTPYGTIKEYCARHGGDLSEEETRELILTLLAARERGSQHGVQD